MPRRSSPAPAGRDPFGELGAKRALPPGLLRRFRDRVLVMTTDRCFKRCPHCTRAFILGRAPVVDTPERLAACVDFVRRHREVMRFGNAVAALDQVEVVRICTRAPVDAPERVTARLARLLGRSKKVWANIHVNTAAEARKAAPAAARLVEAGIPVSSQTVLLKGVNDTPAKMLALLRALSAARIRPYYVFQCDPVAGVSERFAVPLARAREIEEWCAARIGGLALPRFVADVPGASRKVPIERL